MNGYLAAALVGKVGYRFVEKNRPPVVKDISPYWDARNLVARSLTGELTWDAGKGFVRINSPRTQAVIGFLSAERHTLNSTVIESPTHFGAIYVTAMDGYVPIGATRQLVITAVGPARNTGMEYETSALPSRLNHDQRANCNKKAAPKKLGRLWMPVRWTMRLGLLFERHRGRWRRERPASRFAEPEGLRLAFNRRRRPATRAFSLGAFYGRALSGSYGGRFPATRSGAGLTPRICL